MLWILRGGLCPFRSNLLGPRESDPTRLLMARHSPMWRLTGFGNPQNVVFVICATGRLDN